MPPDLSSPNWKIDRAVELLRGLDAEVETWMDSKPYSAYTYVNPEKTRGVVNAREHNPPPIVRWSLIFADIVHNLRCALDHAIWALLTEQFAGAIPKQFHRLTFPIWDAPPSPDQEKLYKPLGPKLYSAIKSVQPYNNPFPSFHLHPLAILRDLDNGNKHRLLFTLMPTAGRVDIVADKISKDCEQKGNSDIFRGNLADGVEISWVQFPIPQPYMELICRSVTVIIAVRHPVANALGQDRDDYAALTDHLILWVRNTINNLVVAAA